MPKSAAKLVLSRGGAKKKGNGQPKGVRYGGRQKGTPNLVSQKVRDDIEASGLESPLEFLLREMRSDPPLQLENESTTMYSVRYRLWSEQRFEAAKAAAPYVHPRLATIESHGKDGGPIQHHITVEFVD